MKMEPKRMIELTVGIVVGLVVFTAILMPVVNNATTTETKFANTGYYTYDAVTEDTNVIIEFDPAKQDKLTINNTEITMPQVSSGSPTQWTLCGSENFTVRYVKTSGGTGPYTLQCYGSNGYIAGDPSATTTVVSLEISNTTMKFNRNDSTSRSYDMGTHGFVINPDGDGTLMLKYPSQNAYVKGDSDIYLCGTTFVTGSGTNDYVGVFGYGTLDDGLTMSSFYGNTSPNTVTFGDVTANYTEVGGYIDLYELESFTFPLTQNSATVTATYSYFVVPTEVTAEKAVHADSQTIAMLNVIPILIIAGLIIGIVGVAITRRE